MTGFGSPCGACKFLRRKCVRGCVFAPYFCDEQGAAHFAAVHKVFGASNVSKLLSQLPINDRSEAALTISYQAQARLQDPVYGCVSHIFALQQQVVNLQSQLTSLKTQAALQEFATSSTSSPQEERLPYNDFYQTQASIPNQSMNVENYMMNYDNGFIESANFSESSHDCNVYSTVSGGSSSCDMKPFYSEGMDDLQSLAFSYMNHT